jgi:cell wall-associated NlpC family hydrolase
MTFSFDCKRGGPVSFGPVPVKTSPSNTRQQRRPSISACLIGLALLLPLTLRAAPDAPVVDSVNPVSRFLSERGLPDPAAAAAAAGARAAPLVQQVRDGASDMVLSAMDFLGVPYRRGGNSAESGFDCSGFTRHVFEQSLGLVLPRRADQQARSAGLFTVQRDDLKPGDLVFFNTLRRTFSHVGIYVGEGKFIHAPKPGGEVRIESMGDSYWAKRFTGARRAPLAAELSGTGGMPSAADVMARSVNRGPAP